MDAKSQLVFLVPKLKFLLVPKLEFGNQKHEKNDKNRRL